MIEAPPDDLVRAWYPLLVEFSRRVVAGARQVPMLELEPTSWWRSIEHNRAVGGEPYSQHLIGTALDVEAEISGSPASIARELVAWAWQQQGLTVVVEPRHVHVQLLPGGQLETWLRAAGVAL